MLASVVAEHVFVLHHQMDLSKARVMDSDPHTQIRCLLESWHIQREQAPLNREKGMWAMTMGAILASVSPSMTNQFPSHSEFTAKLK